ncbi:MAG: FAD-dependent oxidoreductase [Gemmatimonadaceae bacterium]
MRFNVEASRTADPIADVIIIGDGVIGLSTAFELARRHVRCVVIGDHQPGIASEAAAGLLAPSVGQLADAVRPFFFGSLELYPEYVERLREFDPSLTMVRGLIDVTPPEPGRTRHLPARLTTQDVSAREPSIVAPHGATFHASNGAVDSVALMRALRRAAAAEPLVELVDDDPVVTIDLFRADPAVVLRSGARRSGAAIIVAAGAWSSELRGLPHALPVTPLKGQMLAVASKALIHAVMGTDVYLVPRETELVIGATVERAGFDVGTRPEAIELLRQSAERICPALANVPVLRAWAGIRPATPDMLPIIGSDAGDSRINYACGHSKNGILLAPATAAAVADLVQKQRPEFDLAPFSMARFARIS